MKQWVGGARQTTKKSLRWILNTSLADCRSLVVSLHRTALLLKAGAFVYYWIIVLVYSSHPGLLITSCSRSKNTSLTYDAFLQRAWWRNSSPLASSLKSLSITTAMIFTYLMNFNYAGSQERPQIRKSHDVFVAIRDDELEHVKTMIAAATRRPATFQSPHMPTGQLCLNNSAALTSILLT